MSTFNVQCHAIFLEVLVLDIKAFAPFCHQVAGKETWCKSFQSGAMVKCGPAGHPRGGTQQITQLHLRKGRCVSILCLDWPKASG